ncbi:MAG TPA: hypothetical protein VKG80_22285 [Trebonia sp.]|nr:hypothetical protein [Trebonia sp.]
MSRIRCVAGAGDTGPAGSLTWRRVRVTVTEFAGAGGATEAAGPAPLRFVPREEGPAARWLRAERA